ncbi:MAG: riboflavin synthase, partial [Chloroflexota bacterium]
MFTGIVEEVGRVRAVSGSRVVFEAHKVLQGTAVGDSLDVNGVCLTVTALGQDSFMVELMP